MRGPAVVICLALFAIGGAHAQQGAADAAIVLVSEKLRLDVGRDGTLRSLRVAWSERELGVAGEPIARVWRGGTPHDASAARSDGDRLRLEFEGIEPTLELRWRADVHGLRFEPSELPDGAERIELLGLTLADGGLACCGQRVVRVPDAELFLIGDRPQGAITVDGGRPMRWSASLWPELGDTEIVFLLGAARVGTVADAISAVERELRIPLGIEAKRSAAARRPYLMVRGLHEDNADRAVEWAARGGFGSILLQHGVWADYGDRYRVPSRVFPSGLRGLGRVVRAIHERGMLAGAHLFASKLPKRAAATDGRAERRFVEGLTLSLARPFDLSADRIVTTEAPTGWPRVSGTRDLRIGDEIVTFTDLALDEPFGFVGVERGRYGTRPQAHPLGADLHQLVTDESGAIFIIDQRTSLLERHAKEIAATYDAAGFDWIYFDGAEDVHEPRWFRTTLPKTTVIDALAHPPQIVQSAADIGFDWHLTTRRGQRDYFWRFVSYRKEIDHAVAHAVPMARRELMVPDLGWFPVLPPTAAHAGTRLDDVEYLCSRALATDSTFSMMGHIDDLQQLVNRDAVLHMMARYEHHRAAKTFRQPGDDAPAWLTAGQDVLLVERPGFDPGIVPVDELPFVAGKGGEVRAFVGEPIDGTIPVSLMPTGQAVTLEIDLDPWGVRWHDYAGDDLDVEVRAGALLRIPLRSRVFLHVSGQSRWALWMALRAARVSELSR